MDSNAGRISKGVSIREATPADEEAIEHLRSSVRWSTVETGLSAMAQGRAVVYVLEVDGIPSASASLGLQTIDADLADGKEVAHLSNLIVDPAHQNAGLGTRLLHFIEDEARDRGYRSMTIGVDASNLRARHLYERQGYSWLKDRQEIWGPVNYLRKQL